MNHSKASKIMIHPLSDVQTTKIGIGTNIWQYSVILSGAVIGNNCNVNCHTFIEDDVVIGNNVTIKCGTFLWDGIVIEDDVFIGPNVVFTNDLRPRSKKYINPLKTVIKRGASIGANSTILAGVQIGRYAMTGIGSVVTKDIPDYALVYGNPAIIKGWVSEEGEKLTLVSKNIWKSEHNKKYKETAGGLIAL